ncbi:MAG: hypothetical protein FE047_01460 [Thermoplasmata archaeon]|nr:MAG: hypothetical protein FE047_01460 [Thermoplasmata archaeon]
MKIWKEYNIMKIWQIAIAIFSIIAIILLSVFSSFSYPYVEKVSADWVVDDNINIRIKAVVENPNFFSIKIATLICKVFLNDIEIAEGLDKNIVLQRGENNLSVDLFLDTNKIQKWWTKHIKNGERSDVIVEYMAMANFFFFNKTSKTRKLYSTITTDFTQKLSFNKTKAINVSLNGIETTLLFVNKFESKWQYVDENITIINSSIQLYNPNGEEIGIENFTYNVFLNGIKLGEGWLADNITLAPYATVNTYCYTRIQNEEIPDWFESHLRNGETTLYEIRSYAKLLYGDSAYFIQPIEISGNFSTNFLEKVL